MTWKNVLAGCAFWGPVVIAAAVVVLAIVLELLGVVTDYSRQKKHSDTSRDEQ